MAAEKPKKQVMDVAKPGSTGAAPTARPIITGHATLKDPMVTDTSADTKATETVSEVAAAAPQESAPLSPPSHKVIAPLTPETPAEAKTDEAAAKPEETVSNDDQPLGSDEAVVDAVVEQATKKKEGELDEKQKQELEAAQKLVDDKTYFVPIGQVRRRRRMTVLLAVLILILVLAGGAAYAFQAGLINKKTETAQPTATAPVVQSTPKVQVTQPKLTQFSNAELGLKFSYPAEWGASTVSDNTKEATEKGKRAKIVFASQPKIAIGLKASTWKDSSKDVNRACSQPGFITYQVVKTDLGNGRFVLIDKGTYQVYEELTGGLCSDKQVVGDVKFTKSTAYVGLEVLYQDKVQDKFDLAQRISDFQKDKTKYFPASLTGQIVALTASVQEL